MNLAEQFSRLVLYAVPVILAATAFVSQSETQKSEVSNHGFILQDTRFYPEYNFTAELYIHEKHKAPFLNLVTEDTHNFFATTFRTQCIDDTGSTHVLEHLSLQGSKNYPIRSSFMELRKRTMAVFMNAFTSIEWTAYPFSTTNEKDFHNILNVYLDATFNPQLNETAFESECHHLEFEVFDNSSTNLRHSGVVYNEMNGDTSNPSTRFSNLVRENLYPDSLFRHEYGGNPEHIANLTLEKIKEQHGRYYHPANSLFFHYGSFDVSPILAKVNSVISEFSEGSVTIPDELIEQKRWDTPRSMEAEGPAQTDTTKVMVSSSWIVGDLRDVSEVIDLSFLSMLLVSGIDSPLYKALINSGIGTKYIETGFFPYMRSPYFGIGCEGVTPENAANWSNIVLEILNNVYTEGFSKERIDGILHQEEVSQKTVSASQGIKVWEQIISYWIHDVSPFELIDISWELERIKKTLSTQPRYFEMLLKHRLIENVHRLDLTMKGVQGFQEKYSAKVRDELSKLKEQLSEEEKTTLIKKAERIRAAIDEEKPVHLLPEILVDDLSRKEKPPKYIKKGKIFNNIQPTNGIVYVRIKCEVPIDSCDLENIGLMTGFLTLVGASEYNEDEFQSVMKQCTGGISADLSVITTSNGPKVFVTLSGSALSRNTEKLLDLMEKVITSPHLENENVVSTLMTMSAAQITESVIQSGHTYARKYAMASLSPSGALDEVFSGVTSMKKVEEHVKGANWTKTCNELIRAHKECYLKGKFTASIHGSEPEVKQIQDRVNRMMTTLNHASSQKRKYKTLKGQVKQWMKKYENNTLLDIDSSTFFCAVSANVGAESESMSILANILANEYLFRSVREKLGAYGAMATYSRRTGIMSMMSYRDTSPAMVIEAMRESVREAANGVDQAMVNRAIVKAISNMDGPCAPKDVDVDCFYDEEVCLTLKQKNRENILSVTADDVKAAAKRLDEVGFQKIVVVGSNTEDLLPSGLVPVSVVRSEIDRVN